MAAPATKRQAIPEQSIISQSMYPKKLTTMKTPIHFTDNNLIDPTNPITVNLIGAGGTGSHLLTALARMNHALTALDHAGLFVRVYDDDKVSEANLGRQLFAEAELGQYKGVALVNRINRFFGTNWKAIPQRFNGANCGSFPDYGKANIYITCVDTAEARFDIANYLKPLKNQSRYGQNRAFYWLDFGNSRHTGQVVLATIGEIIQPKSEKFTPVATLPFITETYRELLEQKDEGDNLPSCSLAEALTKQDLYINGSLADMGASLLWQLFREGMLTNRGFFLNLKEFRTQPIKVA
jgi:PRTRC genetic system ThiF family protein